MSNSSCITILAHYLANLKKVKDENRLKNRHIDPSEITPDDIKEVFLGTKNVNEIFKDEIFSLYKWNNAQVLFNTLDQSSILKEFKDFLLRDNDHVNIKHKIVGLSQVFKVNVEYANITKKQDVDPEIVTNNKGRYYIPKNQFQKELGRSILESLGYKLPDKKELEAVGEKDLNSYLLKLGEDLLDVLITEGYLKETGKQKVAINEQINEDGTFLTTNLEDEEYKYQPIYEYEETLVVGDKIPDIYLDFLTHPENHKSLQENQLVKDVKYKGKRYLLDKTVENALKTNVKKDIVNTGDSITDVEEIVESKDLVKKSEQDYRDYYTTYIMERVISKLSMLTSPANRTSLRDKPVVEDDKQLQLLEKESAMNITYGALEYALTIQESNPYYIDKTLTKTMLNLIPSFIHQVILNDYSPYKFIRDNNINELLGIDSNDIQVAQTMSEIESMAGKNRTKLDNFMLVLEGLAERIATDYNLDLNDISIVDLKDIISNMTEDDINNIRKFYIAKFRAKNARTNIVDNIMNFETDKTIAREFTNVSKNPITIKTHTTENKYTDEFKILLTHIFSEQLHLSKGVIDKLDFSILIDTLLNNKELNFISLKEANTNPETVKLYNNIITLLKVFRENKHNMFQSSFIAKEYSNNDLLKVKKTTLLNVLKTFDELIENYDPETNTTATVSLPELDANSSGITIKLLHNYLAGSKEAGKLLYRFGMLPDKNGNFIDKSDPEYLPGAYEYIVEKLHELNSKLRETEVDTDEYLGVNNQILKDQKTIEILKELFSDEDINNMSKSQIEELKNNIEIGLNLWEDYLDTSDYRNTVKYPTMIVGAYDMSPKASAKKNIGPELYADWKERWLNNYKDFLKFINIVYSEKEINKFKDLKKLLDKLNDTNTSKKDKKILLSNYLNNYKHELYLKRKLSNTLGTVLARVTNKEFKEGIFNKDTETIKEIWDFLKDVGVNKSFYKVLDLNMLESLDKTSSDIEELLYEYNNKYFLKNDKNYLSLLKTRNVFDPLTETTYLEDVPNMPSATVSTVHMYDSQILHKSIQRLSDEFPNDNIEQYNIMSIHDAVLLPPHLAKRFKEIYIEETFKIINKHNRLELILNSFKLNAYKYIIDKEYSKALKENNAFKKDTENYKKTYDMFKELYKNTKAVSYKTSNGKVKKISIFKYLTIVSKITDPDKRNTYIENMLNLDTLPDNISKYKYQYIDLINNVISKIEDNNELKHEDLIWEELINTFLQDIKRDLNKQLYNSIVTDVLTNTNNYSKDYKTYIDIIDKMNSKLENLNISKIEDIDYILENHTGKIFGEDTIDFNNTSGSLEKQIITNIINRYNTNELSTDDILTISQVAEAIDSSVGYSSEVEQIKLIMEDMPNTFKNLKDKNIDSLINKLNRIKVTYNESTSDIYYSIKSIKFDYNSNNYKAKDTFEKIIQMLILNDYLEYLNKIKYNNNNEIVDNIGGC